MYKIFFFSLVFLMVANDTVGQSIARKPYLQSNSENSIVIRWDTDTPTASKVLFGSSPSSLSNTAFDGTLKTKHELKLTNLQPDTKYYYEVATSNSSLIGGDQNHFFTTHPSIGTPKQLKAWILGDAGEPGKNQRAVRDAYLNRYGSQHADMILMLGDNAYDDGLDEEYQIAVFEDMYEDELRNTPLWATPGNHDLRTGLASPYYDIFTLPTAGESGGVASGAEQYYSFDYGNVHFVSLNTEDEEIELGSPMSNWLISDLSSTTQDWIIAFFHHPAYTFGTHNSDAERNLSAIRQEIVPILESHGVDLVLSGHSHNYERSFLINGHYGKSSSLNSSMILDNGNGQIDGDGAYQKETEGPNKGKGAVYVVSGSASKTGKPKMNTSHPVMVNNLKELGSVYMEIEGGQLYLEFINNLGMISDYMTLEKPIVVENQPPQFVTSSVTLVQPGDNYEYQFEAIDSDGDQLVYVVDPLPSFLNLDLANLTISGATTTADIGNYSIRISVNDGHQDSPTVQEFNLAVKIQENRPPTFISSPTTEINVGDVFSYIPVAEDLDNDQLVYAASNLPPGLVFENNQLIGTFSTQNIGAYEISISVTDGRSDHVSQSFTLTVNPEPPALTTVCSKISQASDDAEQRSGYMDMTSSDLEMIYDRSDQTVGLRFLNLNIPKGASIQSAYIQFQTDESGARDATDLNFKAEISPSPETFSFQDDIYSRDLGNASVSWQPEIWVSAGDRGDKQRSPNLSTVIQEVVNSSSYQTGDPMVIIIDGSGERVAEAFDGDPNGAAEICITYGNGDPNQNQPPVFTSSPSLSITEGNPYQYAPSANDSDGDNLTFEATTLPSWLTFANNNLSGTPQAGDVGQHSIQLTVSDGSNAAVLQNFVITVSAVAQNQPPVFTSSPSLSITEGNPYQYAPSANDVEGDNLTFAATTLPSWLTFANNNLSGTPQAGDVGQHSIQLTVSDGNNAAVLQNFVITVSAVAQNQPPVFTSTPSLSVTEGNPYQYAPSANDVDGDNLTFEATTLPSWLTFANNNLSGTPQAADVGQHSIQLTVSDGNNAAVLQDFVITVQAISQETVSVCSKISQASDDAEQRSGYMDMTSSDLEMIYDRSDQTVGLRFLNLNIPKGASIQSAYIQFQTDESGARDATDLNFKAEISPSPETFSFQNDIYSRDLGNASVSWQPEIWDSAGDRGDKQRSPNLSTVIQEVVNSSSYQTGDPMVIIIDGSGERVAEAFDGDPNGAAEICITYGNGDPNQNQPPVFTSSPSLSITEGNPYQYAPSANDSDGDNLTFAATTLPSWLTFANNNLSGTPQASDVGQHSIQLTVSDGNNAAVLQNFVITVSANAQNQPPVFTSSPSLSITEGNPYQYAPSANDSDGDNLTFAATTLPSWLTFANNNLSGTPQAADVGQHSVQLTVSDGNNAAVLQNFVITVQAISQETVSVCSKISQASDDAEQRSGYMDMTSSDLEMIYDRSDQTVGLRFLNLNIPKGASIQSAYIQFQTDESGARDATDLNFKAEISPSPVTFSFQNDIYSRDLGNASVSWQPEIWDSAGDRGDKQRSPNLSTVIQEVVNSSSYQTGDPMVIIIDGSGERVAEAFDGDPNGAAEICITYGNGDPNQNQPPVFTSSPSLSITEGNPYQYAPSANDVDGDNLTFAATTLPSWLTFANNNLSGTPQAGDVGQHSIQLTVSDGNNAAVLQDFVITVQAISQETVSVCSKISQESDDAEQRSGYLDMTSSDLELIYDRSDQTVGLRFLNLNISKGSLIQSAHIQFQTDESGARNATDLNFKAEISSSPATFSFQDDIYSRNLGNASVSWQPEIWNSAGDRGDKQKSPNLSTLIQEIVSSSSYQTGDPIVIIISGSGERVAEAFDGDQEGAAELCITYTPNALLRPVPIESQINNRFADFDDTLMLFPNPTSKILNVVLAEKQRSTSVGFQIHSADGRMVMKGHSKSAKFFIDISDLTNGLYLLKVENNVEVLSKKFIKN